MPNPAHNPAGSPPDENGNGTGGQFAHNQLGQRAVSVPQNSGSMQSLKDDTMFNMSLQVDRVMVVDSEPVWTNGQMAVYMCESEDGRKMFAEYPMRYEMPEFITHNEFGIHEFVITLSDDKEANGERKPGEPFLAEVKTEYVYHTTFNVQVSKLINVQSVPVIGGFESSSPDARINLDTFDYPYYEPFGLVIDRVVANIQNEM
jgi:hypothetical protein